MNTIFRLQIHGLIILSEIHVDLSLHADGRFLHYSTVNFQLLTLTLEDKSRWSENKNLQQMALLYFDVLFQHHGGRSEENLRTEGSLARIRTRRLLNKRTDVTAI